jgi:glycosyltransferase involved in cell wall biosynthesis
MRDNMRASVLAKLQVPGYLVRQAGATRRLIREKNIDVVNAHWLVPQGLTSAWASRGGLAALVVQVHAGDVYMLRRLPVGRAIARYVVSRSAYVLAAGSHVRDTLDELLGFESGAVLRPMGADLEAFRPDAKNVPPSGDVEAVEAAFTDGFLFFFGRMVEKKGAIYLIRAFPAVREQYPGLGLVLIGDGPEQPRLKQEVQRLGLERSVHFLGRRPRTDIVHHLHRCRAAVVPSIIDRHGETEGMPTVIIESLAAGARVVGSAVDGIPDVITHGRNGWLCREKDPEDLAAKVLLALREPPSSPMIRHAQAAGAHHSWKGVAEDYAMHLRNAASPTQS